MPEVALAALAVFFLLALGGRAWLQKIRTGRWGLTDPAQASARERAAGFMVVGGVLILLAVGIAAWVEPGRLPALADSTAVRVAGLVAIVAGIGLTLAAQLQMGDSWRTGVGGEAAGSLVTHGLFSVVRNPIFLGLGLFGLGYVLLVPTILCAAGWALAAAGIELQVRGVEEPWLLTSHGSAYRDYASRVGRFVPGLGRLPAAGD